MDGKEPKLKTESRNLMCVLTDDEQRMRGVELAAAELRLAALDGEKKQVAEKIKTAEAEIEALAETVKHKQEERPVVCTLTPDYEADSMTVRRTDTGAVVCIRQLTFNERQPDLPLEEKAEAEPGETADAPPDNGSPFLGQTYIYPTPNHGEREVGVVRVGDLHFVGWVKDNDGNLKRLVSSKLMPNVDGAVMQAALDDYAAAHDLKPVAALKMSMGE
jgi:hypothetical protein